MRRSDHETLAHPSARFTRREILRSATLLGIGVGAAPLLSACGSSASGGGSISSFKVAYTSGIDTLNPFATIDVIPSKINQLIFPFLVNVAAPNAPTVPDFSRSWKMSTDGLRISFALHTNGSWSDGHPITAADVAFSLNTFVRFQTGAAATLGSFVDGIHHVEAPDHATVVIHYTKPVAAALSNLANLAILPEHVWQSKATGAGAALKTFQETTGAVTGGPFQLTQYAQNQAVVLGANPKSYTKARVSEIGFLSSSSETGAIQALHAGEANALDAGAIVPRGLSGLQSSNFAVSYQPGLIWYEIAFNSNPAKKRHRELLDPRVRTALSHATDRQNIVATALFGHGQPGSTIIPPAMGAFHNASIPVDDFDLDRANHMLDQLGYKKGSNGIRNAHGTPMSYQMPLANDMPYQPIFDIISQDWGKIGIKLQGQPLDGAAEYEATVAPNGKYLSNDVSMWWWAAQIDPNFFLSLLTKAQLEGYSDTGYVNAKYDQLFAEQSTTLDKAKRAALIHRMQEILYRDKPYLVLCYVDSFSAINKDWAGVHTASSGDFSQTSKQWALDLHRA